MNAETKGLLPEERRRLILDALADQRSVRVTDLAEQLGVTPVTIRRDLELLSSRGEVKRVHGGVTLQNRGASSGPATSAARSLLPSPSPSSDSEPVIGMVVPSLDYYWPSVARGAKDQASRTGMKVILRESAYNSAEQDKKQIEHLVDNAGAQGLILTVDVRDEQTMRLLQDLTDRAVPIVLVERNADLPVDGVPMESVTSDHRSGAVLAVRTLTELGHTRIGIVAPSISPTAPHLKQGWDQACRDLHIQPEATIEALIDNSSPDVLISEIDRVLDTCAEHNITGLLVHADPEANMVVQAAQQRGLDVPGDLSVMAYDDEVASLLTPALTAVRPPRYTIGETAVDLIAARLNNPNRPVQRVILSPRLTIRESTQYRPTQS